MEKDDSKKQSWSIGATPRQSFGKPYKGVLKETHPFLLQVHAAIIMVNQLSLVFIIV